MEVGESPYLEKAWKGGMRGRLRDIRGAYATGRFLNLKQMCHPPLWRYHQGIDVKRHTWDHLSHKIRAECKITVVDYSATEV